MERNLGNRRQRDYLETSFWNEDSEDSDEGIGSDESMDQSDQCSCVRDEGSDNTKNDTNNGSKTSIKQTKEPLSVTKFLKILKLSMVPNTSSFFSAPSRVFGIDLSIHLDSTKTNLPQIVEWCTRTIEGRGKKDIKSLEGVYRLSGQVSHIKALKLSFDAGHPPTKYDAINIHSVGSLLKLYFRELPEPLCVFSLYSDFVRAARLDTANRLAHMKKTLRGLPEEHYRTLSHLMEHLHHLSLSSILTGMTCRNLAIVWAPNLLRSLRQDMASEESLRDIGVQAKVIECFIENYGELFKDKKFSERTDAFHEVSIDQAIARATSLNNFPILRSQQNLYQNSSLKSKKKSSPREDKDQQDNDSLYLSRKPPIHNFTKSGTNFGRDSMPIVQKGKFQKALSSVSISTNSLSSWAPPNSGVHRDSSPQSTYKSLPALDKHFDQLDREFQEISDSVDVLYQQEDTEIEFLDTFLDYDSISINCKESDQESEIKKLSVKGQQGLSPTMASEKERIEPRKDRIRERIKSLTNRSKLSLRNFGSRENLQNMKEGLQKSKERLSSALSPSKIRQGSYEWSVRRSSDGRNCRT